MQIAEQQVVDLVTSTTGGDQAQQADSEMPDQVDTDRDSGLLQESGVDPEELLGGGGGGIGSELGL